MVFPVSLNPEIGPPEGRGDGSFNEEWSQVYWITEESTYATNGDSSTCVWTKESFVSSSSEREECVRFLVLRRSGRVKSAFFLDFLDPLAECSCFLGTVGVMLLIPRLRRNSWFRRMLSSRFCSYSKGRVVQKNEESEDCFNFEVDGEDMAADPTWGGKKGREVREEKGFRVFFKF